MYLIIVFLSGVSLAEIPSPQNNRHESASNPSNSSKINSDSTILLSYSAIVNRQEIDFEIEKASHCENGNFIDSKNASLIKFIPSFKEKLENNEKKIFNFQTPPIGLDMKLENKVDITFSIVETKIIRLGLFNYMGQEKNCFINNELQTGKYTVRIDTKELDTGMYYLKLYQGTYVQVKSLSIKK